MQLNELIEHIAYIRRAADEIEVKGVRNMGFIINICERCEHIVTDLQQTAEKIQNESKEVGEANGESDSGAT